MTHSKTTSPSTPCFDAGTRYCPCHLAELGQCVACSLLRGSETCDCGWNGLCIYQEFMRTKRSTPPREAVNAMLLEKRPITRDGQAFFAKLKVPETIACWCTFPGSFVMVRPPGTPERYNVPLSVMEASGDQVSLAVEVAGPKTRALALCPEGTSLIVVAPFWSGLQGLNHLRRHAHGRILGIAKGIAQAALVQVARYVSQRGGKARMLVGPGTLGNVFADDLLASYGAEVSVLPREPDHNVGYLRKILSDETFDVIVSAGSDQQHRAVHELAAQLEPKPHFAWFSNFRMTCAEGICGSCIARGLRGCKCMFKDPETSYSDVSWPDRRVWT